MLICVPFVVRLYNCFRYDVRKVTRVNLSEAFFTNLDLVISPQESRNRLSTRFDQFERHGEFEISNS